MSKALRMLIALIILAAGCFGAYYFFIKEEPTPTEETINSETTLSSTEEQIEEPSKEYNEEATYNKDDQITITSRDAPVENEGSRKFIKTIRFDVPFENQLDKPALENGGGITALSMLLNYYRLGTSKNELADKLPIEPYEKDGLHGDPTKGFVGDLEKGQALGVLAEPIAKVAQEVVGDSYQVVMSDQMPFEELLEQVQRNRPVWITASKDLKVPRNGDYQQWSTEAGRMNMPKYIHAVVIVGMDQYRVYINDPLGEEEKEIKMGEMKEIYEKMGSQSIYLKKN
ncbi:hypothetical protein DOK78_000950 [Enterococcus sp. DIV2402]|uniref:Peptidase C39-like domain-containing protein n=1 Tax=Candidatus Enterococcus lowellii TaxID=2230877 RepID=A0ABZ2SR28_9ENTE|nr:C39 family peptidase [Enterococcus sp. DIV2402]